MITHDNETFIRSRDEMFCSYIFSNIFHMLHDLQNDEEKYNPVLVLILRLFLVKFMSKKVDEVLSLFIDEIKAIEQKLEECKEYFELIDKLRDKIKTYYQ